MMCDTTPGRRGPGGHGTAWNDSSPSMCISTSEAASVNESSNNSETLLGSSSLLKTKSLMPFVNSVISSKKLASALCPRPMAKMRFVKRFSVTF